MIEKSKNSKSGLFGNLEKNSCLMIEKSKNMLGVVEVF
jgi:hypothetical protein